MLIRMCEIKAACWVYAVHMQGRFDLDFIVPHRASFVISDQFYFEPSGGETYFDTCEL